MDRRNFIRLAARAVAVATVSPAGVLLPPWQAAAQRKLPTRFLGKFLAWPYQLGTDITISEGDKYTAAESLIHKYPIHYALDVSVRKRRVKVYAPCGGWAFRTFQSFIVPNISYLGKSVGFGLGWHYNIWVEDLRVWVQIGHLGSYNPEISYLAPEVDSHGIYTPDNRKLYKDGGPADISKLTRVRMGDLLGEVGCSGLAWGWQESPTKWARDTWDRIQGTNEPDLHVHMEVHARLKENGAKDSNNRWPLMGWTESVDENPAYAEKRQHPVTGLFLETDGKIAYAKV